MQRFFVILLICAALALTACGHNQMFKESWKFTKRQYTTYLNTPATLDMNAKGNWEVYELALGEAVFTIDSELQRLVRAMENSDHNPDQNWVLSMMGRFPWLSGVALVDRDGALIAQYPEHFPKPFDATPLVESDPKQHPGDLRAYAQISPAGPEIYVANPVYGSGAEVLRGLIISHFDPRLLATMTRDPGSFMLVSSAGMLWHGQHSPESIALVEAQDWADILRRRSYGIIGNRRDGYFWTTRYVGNLPIIYVISVSATPTFSTERSSSSFFGNWRRSTPARQPEQAQEPVGPTAISQAIPEADFLPQPEMPAPDVPHRAVP